MKFHSRCLANATARILVGSCLILGLPLLMETAGCAQTDISPPTPVLPTDKTKPPVDALIRLSSSQTNVGGNIINLDGADQTVSDKIFAGETTIYQATLKKKSVDSFASLKVAGTAGANGWIVRYFDADTDGEDITSQVSGPNGWTPKVVNGDVHLRLEVKAPENITGYQSFDSLLTTTHSKDLQIGDAVKTITAATPQIQPDLEIKLPEDRTYVGLGKIAGDGTNQKRSVLLPVKASQTYLLRLRNTSPHEGDLILKAPPTPAGWTVRYFNSVDATASDITSSVTSKGWRLENLPPGEIRELKLSIASGFPAPDDNPFLLQAYGGPGHADGVIAELLPQFLLGLEEDVDNDETFAAIPEGGTLAVEAGTTFSFRAVQGRKRAGMGINGWPIVNNKDMTPVWTCSATPQSNMYGSMVAMQAPRAAVGTEFDCTVTCGNTKTFKLKIKTPTPEIYQISVWQDYKAPANPETKAKRRVVGALVTTTKGKPVPGVKVTFTGTGLIVVPPKDPAGSGISDDGGYVTAIVESTGGDSATVTASIPGGQPGQTAQCQVKF